MEHSAAGELAIVASLLDGKPMAQVLSDVVGRTHSAVGNKRRDVGHISGSAAGEEQAREDGMRSVWASRRLQLADNRADSRAPCNEIINIGMFGAVCKAVNN